MQPYTHTHTNSDMKTLISHNAQCNEDKIESYFEGYCDGLCSFQVCTSWNYIETAQAIISGGQLEVIKL